MHSVAPLGLVPDPTDSAILAHQGGWDEILLVVGPLVLVAGLLWLANRRVSAQLEAAEAAGGDAGTTTADDQALEDRDDAEGSPDTDNRF